MVKNLLASAGDTDSIPGSRRSPGGGSDQPLQYSCLENSMDRGAWWATVHGVTKVTTPTVTSYCFCCRKRGPFQGLKLGSCLTLGNDLSEETHVLTKQEILLGKSAQVESSRVMGPRRTSLPLGLRF